MPVRVLFITSDTNLADAVKAGLGSTGFEVAAHDNLMGLYTHVVRLEPDVLLLDGDLPRLGLEASSKFLKAKGLSRNLPVVLYTSASGDEDAVMLAQRCQAEDFVEKDRLDFAPLKRTLRRVAPHATAFESVETAEHSRPVARSTEGKPVVLVVDDDDKIAQLLKKILESKYAVVAVNDGAAAIEQCRKQSFAAVFCDLKMPQVSGPDVFRAIIGMDAALADRVIFVTAHQLDSAEAEFFLTLKNHVVHKPFSMREILAVAEQVVGKTVAPTAG